MLRPDTPSDAVFRAEVRSWLASHVPASQRHQTFRPLPAEGMPWYRLLSQRGWIAPHWPREHGGMGASIVRQVILMEELAASGAPDIPMQGLNHIGPTLIARGTAEQQSRHLPPILSGDAIWCQGYSEPGSGSDLASLRTSAKVSGDKLVINGQKIWTTWGHHANWMFALVRTDNQVKPQKGITFVLIDMASPGITCRPIRTIAGEDEFAEVFFNDVQVPLENVVGQINQGWSVATAVLSDERLRIGSPATALKALARLNMLLRHPSVGPVDEAILERAACAQAAVDTLTSAYITAGQAHERGIAADSSYLKVLATETVLQVLDVAQEVAGPCACLAQPQRVGEDYLDFTQMMLQSRRLTIYGGSNEIQRNLIATRVLGLPVAGRV